MAETEEAQDTDKKDASGDDRDFIKEAMARYKRAWEHDRENIEKARDDLKFLDGQDGQQWHDTDRKNREIDGRPCLTMNFLPQFVHQVTGDMRLNRPAIKVVAVDKQAQDAKAEQIYGNMIRYIENRSTAKAAYARATDSQVAAGIGHFKIVTEYADESSMNLEIGIEAITDGLSVLWDPEAQKPAKEDAMFCFEPVDMARTTFKKKWPDKMPGELGDTTYRADGWFGDDFVRVARYWVKEPIKRKLAIFPDGSVDDLTDQWDEAEASGALTFIASQGGKIEERDGFKVCSYLITCSDKLETEDWKGRYIPIVPVVGEEIVNGRKIVRKGIVRNAKDPQRLSNYFHSAQAETVALQPKAPYMATKANVEEFADVWKTANRKNYSTLIYTPDPANGGIPPKRIQPAVASQGIAEGIQVATANIKSVIGIYDSGLGAKSNETSGKAILARQREGDIGTYLYVQNFEIALAHAGRILVDLIPHIYDTQRIVRVVGEDGKVDTVSINAPDGDGIINKLVNDITVGTYDVVLDSGPSFTTKRDEAREVMTAFIQSAPDTAPILLDQIVATLPLPNADKIAKRAKMLLPEPIRQAEEAEEQGQNQAPGMPPQAPQPDPAQMMQQQAQEMQFQAGAAELEAKVREANAKAQQAEANARKAETELQIKLVELERARRDFMNPPTPEQHAQPQ